jgi:glycosyltransferase involved in cell wall biosynthesis
VPPLRVEAAGHLTHIDKRYLRDVLDKVRQLKLGDRFEYRGELSRGEKISFLQSLDMLSLPTVYRESKGLPVLEAWANAVPVVLPAHGTFPELIADAQGGLLHQPDDPVDLAANLKRLLLNPVEAAELGQRGHAAVLDRYHAGLMAERTLAVYEQLVARPAAAHG